jgi:hypothetical protein
MATNLRTSRITLEMTKDKPLLTPGLLTTSETHMEPYSTMPDRATANFCAPSPKSAAPACDLRRAHAFTDAAALNRREIDVAGDVRTMPEAAEIPTEALGRPVAFAQTPIEQVRSGSTRIWR